MSLLNRLGVNTPLMTKRLAGGGGGHKAIAIDANYISKAGKKTPYLYREVLARLHLGHVKRG